MEDNARKGRYLLFGIDEFYNNHKSPLSNCVNDTNYWKGILANDFYYSENESIYLTNSTATLSNFIIGMIYLAKNSGPNDIVFISISTHGKYEITIGANHAHSKFSSYYKNQSITSNILSFLLKFFIKGVRICLIFDICQSKNFIADNEFDTLFEDDKIAICNAFEDYNLEFPNEFFELMDKNNKIPFSASIWEINSVSNFHNAEDGWISKLTKNDIFVGWGKYNYTVKDFHKSLIKGFDKEAMKFLGHFKYYLFEIESNKFPETMKFANDEIKRLKIDGFKAYICLILEYPFSQFNPFYRIFDSEFKRVIFSFSKDEKIEYYDLKRKLDRQKELYDIVTYDMPYLTFSGVKNQLFEKQYIFRQI